MILGDRRAALAVVDRHRRPVHDAADAGAGRCLEHVARALDVDADVLVVIARAAAEHPAEREHGGVRYPRVDARERVRQARTVAEIRDPELDAGAREIGAALGVADHPDHVRAPTPQHVDDVAPEEAGRAGHGDAGGHSRHRLSK